MTTKQEAALRQALEALEFIRRWGEPEEGVLKRDEAITAIREALAEQPAEYVSESDTEELLELNNLPEPLRLAAMLEKTMQWPLHGKAADCLRKMYAAIEQPAQVDPCIDGSCSCCWTHLDEQPAQQPTDERIDALRTLDYCHGLKAGWNFCAADDDAGFERAMAGTSEAVRILKTQPAQQEPVAKVCHDLDGHIGWNPKLTQLPDEGASLYTSPQSRPWVGLTQQDIDIAFDDTQEGGGFDDFARAIEAKLREKNA